MKNLNAMLVGVIALLVANAGQADALVVQQSLIGSSVNTPIEGAVDAGAPGSECPMPLMHVQAQCNGSGSFLCAQTSSLGVTSDVMRVSGHIDRTLGHLSALRVIVQHDQTKTFTTHELGSDVSVDGRFAQDIALPHVGNYTLTVTAFRASGTPAQETLHVARVQAPNLEHATVVYEPQAEGGAALQTDHVTLTVDLFAQCENCDTVGSGANAATVRVTNRVRLPSGEVQHVVRSSNVAQRGVYQLCVPTRTGDNQLHIEVCNAATGETCPQLDPIDVRVRDTHVAIHPELEVWKGRVMFSAVHYDTVPLRFRVDGLSETESECSDAVTVEVNRERSAPLCPDADGMYHMEMTPITGINLAVIHVQTPQASASYPVTFGWGDLQSPWNNDGSLKSDEELWFADALTFGVRQDFLSQTIRELINNFTRSDQFETFLADMAFGRPAPQDHDVETTEGPAAESLAHIRDSIPYCATEQSSSNMVIELADRPQVGGFEITRIAFGDDEAQLSLELRDVSALLRYYRDNDEDGTPDAAVLPLHVAFKRLAMHPRIRLIRGESPQVLFTADTTECDFKSDRFCTEKPAIVVPKNFFGAANEAGAFVQCDHKQQEIDPSQVEGCKSLNMINAHMGVLSEKVLDALNETLYCSASSMLTYALRDGASQVDVHAGCAPVGHDAHDSSIQINALSCEAAQSSLFADRYWHVPMGVNLTESLLHGNTRGMWARIATRIGDSQFFAGLTETVRHAGTGFITAPRAPRIPADQALAGKQDVFFGLSNHLLNQLLFTLTMQGETAHARDVFGSIVGNGGGLLDWDLHRGLLQDVGFDPVASCEGDGEPHQLCPVRPRMNELMGPAITTEGYFAADHPLMLRIRGSRRLMPRLRFYEDDVPVPATEEGQLPSTRPAQLIELQIPDLAVSFYALERDTNGALVYDDAGIPVIESVLPDIDDPLLGYIVRARATLLVTLELVSVAPSETNPEHVQVVLRTEPTMARVGFAADAESNNTVIPTKRLLSALQQKINYGMTLFAGRNANDDNVITLNVPKRLVLSTPADAESIAGMLGLRELRLPKESVHFGVDVGQDFLTLGGKMHFLQRLSVDGEAREWSIPQ